jgi:hypothetical protein
MMCSLAWFYTGSKDLLLSVPSGLFSCPSPLWPESCYWCWKCPIWGSYQVIAVSADFYFQKRSTYMIFPMQYMWEITRWKVTIHLYDLKMMEWFEDKIQSSFLARYDRTEKNIVSMFHSGGYWVNLLVRKLLCQCFRQGYIGSMF